MKLLLDTHIFLWLNNAPEKLSARARHCCEDMENQLYLSIASIWEIQIKHQMGKLELQKPLSILVETQRQENNLQVLPMLPEHVYALAKLPDYHRDPFDRILISQAMMESMSLVTVDDKVIQYPVATIG